jgi:threonine/homoserine/homoserine lactone efflux protein
MILDTFLRSILLGFSIAAPVGPIGILCIRRTLAQGRAYGFVSGLGAATADGIYGLIGGLGLGVVATFLVDQSVWLKLIGGVFLCYLGIRAILAKPAQTEATPTLRASGLIGAYASILLLTLTNPLTIVSFAAMFASMGAAAVRVGIVPIVIGVFCGSALWWLLLSSVAGALRQRLTPALMMWVNRISGSVVFLLGATALASVVLGFIGT